MASPSKSARQDSPSKGDAKRVAKPPIVALKDVKLQDGSVMLFDGVDLAIEARSRA